MKILKTLRNRQADQGGFTLIELLVVIGILAILLSITLIAINPNKHFEDTRNTQRSSNVSEILNAIYEYESANNGNEPADIKALTSGTSYEICETGGTVTCPANNVDLCSDLTPTYLADLPYDPSSAYGIVSGGATPCSPSTTGYDTGYTITTSSSSGRITIDAPHAEDSVTISVTR